MQPPIEDILARRRDRTLSYLLGYKENEIDKHLPAEVRASFRRCIVKAIHEYHDLVIDVLSSVDQGQTVVNELYLDKLEDIRQLIVSNGSP